MRPNNYILSMLPKLRECFDGHPVEKVWLFGSFSRGEETAESDVDFLVRYDNSEGLSLLSVARLYRALKRLLGREVDVVEEGYLLPYAEQSCDRDKILIYERTS